MDGSRSNPFDLGHTGCLPMPPHSVPRARSKTSPHGHDALHRNYAHSSDVFSSLVSFASLTSQEKKANSIQALVNSVAPAFLSLTTRFLRYPTLRSLSAVHRFRLSLVTLFR
ncbi:hypothetical protein CpipJ_CPIJ006940 [Culex quinquefasciatus]|uniref:Uncharacterized protein n=1 Tax=Culex quinquefasciatus TaxID=7176 RepID=B0WIL1_CULQU|nr:hypothetical protein CpipJ_CPIJ006940 [Culex quinquefasciatus]|eukprot:XP_001848545.1 hypothetical protein CpipJ_CPIJ006940 [Culex quinquefasciatus]